MYNFTVMDRNEPITQVYVSDDHKDVKIEKLVSNSMLQPFQGTDFSINRVYGFLKSRCYEDGRADLADILRQAGLEDNNPWEWNRITHGVMWDDQLWLKFEGENLSWEEVRCRND